VCACVLSVCMCVECGNVLCVCVMSVCICVRMCVECVCCICVLRCACVEYVNPSIHI